MPYQPALRAHGLRTHHSNCQGDAALKSAEDSSVLLTKQGRFWGPCCIVKSLCNETGDSVCVCVCVRVCARVSRSVVSHSLWPMNSSPPCLCIHRLLQARTLEWVAILFSRGFSQPRDRTWVSCIIGTFFINQATKEAQETKVTIIYQKVTLLYI